MLFSKHPSKAPDQLELHKAALLYHKQKHTLPPMQQVQKPPVHSPEESIQQIVGASTDSQISIGNVFQDGIASLPVMYLPEHHLIRLLALKMQRADNSSSPIVERKQVEQAKRVMRSEGVEKRKLVQNLLPKTDIATYKKPMHISNLFRAHFHKPNIRTASDRLFSKSPKAEIEEKVNTHIEEGTKTNSIPPAPLNDSEWPLLPPETGSTSNLALRPGAEHNRDNYENTITVGEENKDESHCHHNLESTKISETMTEEKQELDIGPLEASRMRLYQAWKRRILELSGAKEVE
ncbi:hypothetical protein BOTNAR_0181g00100 [Botryotinia narcissicola]|uniref:Uncharacterized protein n=1 Tax=Botryotinia narcissicola TaxID=278944 RepID=A0A4Z1ICW3_9HELO|nr:hypothetical protein BOTNAR_0181g00100 [Botryotinia narcissicola]